MNNNRRVVALKCFVGGRAWLGVAAALLLLGGCGSGSTPSAITSPQPERLVFDRKFETPDQVVITIAAPVEIPLEEVKQMYSGLRTWTVHVEVENHRQFETSVPDLVVQCGALSVGEQVGGTVSADDVVRPGARAAGDILVSAPAVVDSGVVRAMACDQPRLRLTSAGYAAYSDVLASP